MDGAEMTNFPSTVWSVDLENEDPTSPSEVLILAASQASANFKSLERREDGAVWGDG
jgi:hypothetical protein